MLHNVPGLVKAVILTFVCLSLYFLYGFRQFYRDPGSIFFDPAKAFERSYSLYREAEAEAFRDRAFFARSTNRSDVLPLWKAASSPTICAVMVTVGRNNDNGTHPLEVFRSCQTQI